MKKLLALYFAALFILLTYVVNSYAQVTWTKNSNNPVLYPGEEGFWDTGVIQVDAVIFDGSSYHMWYTGSATLGGITKIGYATSSDGISWRKYNNNPVFTAGGVGQWDESGPNSVSIIFHNGIFRMWYGSFSGKIGYATSPDGINWTRNSNNPVLNPGASGSWDDLAVQQPFVMFDENTYHMWYHGTDNFNSFNIGYATSPDGIVWTKNANNPVLNHGSQGNWDSQYIVSPFVIKKDLMFHMWYAGFDGQVGAIGYATSTNGVNWTKSSSNPVLSPGNPGEWDSNGIGSPTLVFNNPNYQMWYFGISSTDFFRIGLATSATISDISGKSEVANKFFLSQNYPNPFNPSTNIQFSITKAEFVTLKIYNLLGQEIATLVSKKLMAGNYTYLWDAGLLSTGIYIYRIESENFVQTKKMVLVK